MLALLLKYAYKDKLTPQDHLDRFFYFHPEVGCLGRMALAILPFIIDAGLWYLAVKYSDPDLLGAAFVGVPVALFFSLALAQSK